MPLQEKQSSFLGIDALQLLAIKDQDPEWWSDLELIVYPVGNRWFRTGGTH